MYFAHMFCTLVLHTCFAHMRSLSGFDFPGLFAILAWRNQDTVIWTQRPNLLLSGSHKEPPWVRQTGQASARYPGMRNCCSKFFFLVQSLIFCFFPPKEFYFSIYVHLVSCILYAISECTGLKQPGSSVCVFLCSLQRATCGRFHQQNWELLLQQLNQFASHSIQLLQKYALFWQK